MLNSLRGRTIAAASLVLAAFLGFTAVALEAAFRETGLELVRERQEAQLYALLAAAEPAAGGGISMDAVPEPRFAVPDSGHYALVRDARAGVVWRSRSLLGRELELQVPATAGDMRFGEHRTGWGEALFTLTYRVYWEMDDGGERVLDVVLGVTRSDFDARLARFRNDLWLRLAGLAAGLLIAQALVLHLGLAPLGRLARELRLIESGERDTLDENQPRELRSLAENMNHLILFGRRTLERHRNALADLAHALKTPLAVLRGAAEDAPDVQAPLRGTVLDSVQRMDEALSYRLRRASASGGATLGPPVDAAPLVNRLLATFRKVYAERGLTLSADVAPSLAVRVDEGDLTEILGNLLDNACKWARREVWLGVSHQEDMVVIQVDDDGPGIPAEERERILERGERADERIPGTGLGLSLVREIAAEHYGGTVHVTQRPGGGARVRVSLSFAG